MDDLRNENVVKESALNESVQNESAVNQSALNASASSAQVPSERKESGVLTVYKKKSTFKGAGDEDFWYSATRSDGSSVICKFKCTIPMDSLAFEIYDIVGTAKKKEVEVKGEKYTNYTYYITDCKFQEIKGEPLPF